MKKCKCATVLFSAENVLFIACLLFNRKQWSRGGSFELLFVFDGTISLKLNYFSNSVTIVD